MEVITSPAHSSTRTTLVLSVSGPNLGKGLFQNYETSGPNLGKGLFQNYETIQLIQIFKSVIHRTANILAHQILPLI